MGAPLRNFNRHLLLPDSQNLGISGNNPLTEFGALHGKILQVDFKNRLVCWWQWYAISFLFGGAGYICMLRWLAFIIQKKWKFTMFYKQNRGPVLLLPLHLFIIMHGIIPVNVNRRSLERLVTPCKLLSTLLFVVPSASSTQQWNFFCDDFCYAALLILFHDNRDLIHHFTLKSMTSHCLLKLISILIDSVCSCVSRCPNLQYPDWFTVEVYDAVRVNKKLQMQSQRSNNAKSMVVFTAPNKTKKIQIKNSHSRYLENIESSL